MATLYRQYRPNTFAEVVGQEHVVHILRQAILKNRVAHAYLFYGPRGTGKTTMARLLAKRLNCQKAAADDAEPCTRCESCLAHRAGNSLDVLEIDAASYRGIDDIRALRDGIRLKPAVSRYKVYIIDEVHMLTHEAFSALLKTLEEPAAHAIFILATTEFHKVPPTIVSRCQVYRFRRATAEELKGRLSFILKKEKARADEATLHFIIQRSDGCFRDAESLLGQLLTAQGKNIEHDQAMEFLGLPPTYLLDGFLTGLVAGTSSPALQSIEEAMAGGFDPEIFLREAIVRSRDAAVGLARGDASLPAFAQAPLAARRLPVIIRALLQGLQDLAFVPQPLIALQLAILTVCREKGAAAVQSAPNPAAKVVAPQPVEKNNVAHVTLDAIKMIWPQIIQKTRDSHPVVSTFLRAMEPVEIANDTLTIRGKYELHRVFFEKAEHRELVMRFIRELSGENLTLRFITQSAQEPANEQETAAAGASLYESVKDVFGKT